MLIDSFHRVHSYLRISLTDKCNLRCFYCMPNEDHPFVPSSHLMNADEIYSIASSFVKLGVKKIRLTGGEPLIRNDAHEIIENLTRLPAELSLTTNGTRIHKFGDLILNSGIKSINISLDTLQRERFLKITRRDSFNQVISNIEWLLSLKIQVKINVVAMKGENEDEIIDFIRYTQTKPVQVRFIEFMPFSGNNWNIQRVLTLQEILSAINAEFLVEKLEDKPNDTAKNYKVRGYQGSFAIISTLSSPFCNTCNRIRLTADGKIKNCLFSKSEIDLLSALRKGESLEILIHQSLKAKAYERGGQFPQDLEKIIPESIQNRSMIDIGG